MRSLAASVGKENPDVKTFCCSVIAVIIFSVLATMAIAGDGSDKNEPKRDQHPWGQPVEGLRLSLRCAQTKYVVGDKIEVQVVIQNVDTKNQKVVDAHPLFIFDFQVMGPDGKALPLSKRGGAIVESAREGGKVTFHNLKPQEEIAFSLDLSEIYDLQNPGQYRVTAIMDIQQQKDEDKWSKLTSNPLTVTITEAKEKKDK